MYNMSTCVQPSPCKNVTDYLVACLKDFQVSKYEFEIDGMNKYHIKSKCLRCMQYRRLVRERIKPNLNYPANIELVCNMCTKSNLHKRDLLMSYLKLEQSDKHDIIYDEHEKTYKLMSQCLYCNMFTILTKDHIVPVAYGGSNDEENIAMVCEFCNKDKADRTLEEWLPYASYGSKESITYLLELGIRGKFAVMDYSSQVSFNPDNFVSLNSPLDSYEHVDSSSLDSSFELSDNESPYAYDNSSSNNYILSDLMLEPPNLELSRHYNNSPELKAI